MVQNFLLRRNGRDQALTLVYVETNQNACPYSKYEQAVPPAADTSVYCIPEGSQRVGLIFFRLLFDVTNSQYPDFFLRMPVGHPV